MLHVSELALQITRGRSAQDSPNHSRRLLCSDAISDKAIDHTEKVRNAMEISYRAFIHCIHNRCRQHALALSRRRICEKSQNAPIPITISDGDIYRLKAECHLSKFYMATIIVAVEWTLWRLHIVDAKKKYTVSNDISDKDIDDIEKLRIPWHVTHQQLL